MDNERSNAFEHDNLKVGTVIEVIPFYRDSSIAVRDAQLRVFFTVSVSK